MGASHRAGIDRKPQASGRRNARRALLAAAIMRCDGHSWLLLKVLIRSFFSLALALFLVVCSLKYRYRHGNPCGGFPAAARKLNLNNCLFSPIAAEERFEVHPFRSSAMLTIESREESAAEYDPHFRNIEIGESTSGSYNQARRKLGMGGRSNVDLFSTIFKDLIDEGLLRTDHKVLCLGADADEEVIALKERGVTKTIAVDQAQETRRKQLFADETFDFEFTTEFDNVPYPALLVSEIERTLKVGGVAAMYVSLATWRERFMSTEFGHQIKPVTLLFRHSKIVYVTTADAPGLDTIIVFKKNLILRPKGTSATTKSSNKRGNDNHAMPEAAAGELDSALKVEGMKSRPIPDVAEPLKHALYVYIEIGAGDFDHCMSAWLERQNPKSSGSEFRACIEREGPSQASYALNSEGFPLYATWIRNWSVVIGKNFWLQYHSSGDEAMEMMIAEGVELTDWLNKTVVDDNFVVIKMNGEGTNLELVSRMIEAGTISLIDEIFLVCQHQTGWKGIILGATYLRSDTECSTLYEMLHNSGVVVHYQ